MKILRILFLLFLSVQVGAQNITKYDLVQGKSSSNPENLYTTSHKIYFYANNKDSNYKLHSIDTSGKVIEEVSRKRAWQKTISYQQNIININDTIYFAGFDSTTGPPLWDWVMRDKLWALYPDGSTAKIEDINTSQDVSIPAYSTELNGKLYFFGFRHYATQRLFEYDPANKKIRELTKYLWQVPYDDNAILGITTYHGRLYFPAKDSATGIELYTYDPNLDSLWLIADLEPGTKASGPNRFIVYNEHLYFTAGAGGKSYLYEYNDLNNNIQIADTINGGFWINDTKNRYPVIFKNAIYFPYSDYALQHFTIAKYDTSTKQITTTPIKQFNYNIKEIQVYNNKIYFTAFNKHDLNESRLMVYDGDTTITILYDTLYNPRDLTVFNGDLYFTARSASEYGTELYRYNDSATPPPSAIGSLNNLALEVTAYPNPTYDVAYLQFTLNTALTLNILLTDMNGRIVYQSGNILYSASKHTIDIPMQHLPAGNYIYNIYGLYETTLVAGKLIKN